MKAKPQQAVLISKLWLQRLYSIKSVLEDYNYCVRAQWDIDNLMKYVIEKEAVDVQKFPERTNNYFVL